MMRVVNLWKKLNWHAYEDQSRRIDRRKPLQYSHFDTNRHETDGQTDRQTDAGIAQRRGG